MNSIRLIYKMTSQLNNEEINDSLWVFNHTFGSNYNMNYFKWKYEENVYGDSLHCLGYDGDAPILSRVFWRNDIGRLKAYQPVDTAVLPSHQGRGLFKTTALKALELLSNSYIYNYPNSNSRPGYLKTGWKIKQCKYISFNLRNIVLNHYSKKEPIEDSYVDWRFVRNPIKTYNTIKYKDSYFLLSERQPGLYAVLGKISNNFGLKHAEPFLLFSYDAHGFLFKLIYKKVIIVENTLHTSLEGPIPAHRFDML